MYNNLYFAPNAHTQGRFSPSFDPKQLVSAALDYSSPLPVSGSSMAIANFSECSIVGHGSKEIKEKHALDSAKYIASYFAEKKLEVHLSGSFRKVEVPGSATPVLSPILLFGKDNHDNKLNIGAFVPVYGLNEYGKYSRELVGFYPVFGDVEHTDTVRISTAGSTGTNYFIPLERLLNFSPKEKTNSLQPAAVGETTPTMVAL